MVNHRSEGEPVAEGKVRCTRCFLPNTYTNIDLDKKGVSRVCRESHEQYSSIDWKAWEKTSSLAEHTGVLEETAALLKSCGYLSTQCLPSLKRPFWKVFLELGSLIRPSTKDANCFTPTAVPGFHANRFLKGKQKLKTAYAMFFLNREVSGSSAEELLGADLLKRLIDSNMVTLSGMYARSVIRFVPWKKYLILSDPDEGADRGTDFYVYVGGDSTLLTDFVEKHLKPDFKADRGLDLCAGTSIQSLNLIPRCRTITAVELNPRAVAFAGLTSRINGAERIEVIQSDLWENVTGEYDIIVSNPPYMPIPGDSISVKTLDACGGGELGLDIPLRIIDGLGRHLNPRGYSAVLAASPIIHGKDVLRENLMPIADKHGLSIKIHAWKYTNLKLDMDLQRRKSISHFVFCVIESRKTGSPSVKTVHQPLIRRIPQILAARLEMLLKG